MKLRKKQLYAILLAGTLAAGAVPSAVWAAEDAAAVSETSESSADTPAGEEEGNASQPDAQQTPAADDTAAETPSGPAQAPAESEQTPEAAEPTQAPAAENEVTEVPVQQENAAASPRQKTSRQQIREFSLLLFPKTDRKRKIIMRAFRRL